MGEVAVEGAVVRVLVEDLGDVVGGGAAEEEEREEEREADTHVDHDYVCYCCWCC